MHVSKLLRVVFQLTHSELLLLLEKRSRYWGARQLMWLQVDNDDISIDDYMVIKVDSPCGSLGTSRGSCCSISLLATIGNDGLKAGLLRLKRLSSRCASSCCCCRCCQTMNPMSNRVALNSSLRITTPARAAQILQPPIGIIIRHLFLRHHRH